MAILSKLWFEIQANLFPFMREHLGSLSQREQKLVAILELVRIEEFVPDPWWNRGRKQSPRWKLARAFVAKVVYNESETSRFIDRLRKDGNLQQICGWQSAHEIPSESTFCRSFAEFMQTELPQRVHAALIEKYEKPRLVGHISRDATDIPARERPAKKVKPKQKPKSKRGRPRSGEVRQKKQPTRLERQLKMPLPQMLSDLPCLCDRGCKKKGGRKYYWIGYKLHVDWADGEIPVSCLLTAASLHDSQTAIPLETITASRVVSFYSLMDAAYDAWPIRAHSLSLGHVPIIDPNPRGDSDRWPLEPAQKQRLRERSTAERGFSLLKECFGGANIRVRGPDKVHAHLMFSILALTADRLLNLVL